jgi:Recombination, repair and ssDNA binding protein UvsY
MLKPPVKLEELSEEYHKDIILDKENLDLELLKIPSLTAKYLAILSHHRMITHSLEEKYRVMREKRAAYYRGEYCLEDLEEEGWEQYQGNKITMPSAVKEVLDNDAVLVPILLKMEMNQVIIKKVEDIVRELNNRGYNIGRAIEHRKFFKGMN